MTDARFSSSGKLSRWARQAGRLAVVGLIVAATVASLDADARRMGGGRSFGRQSSSMMQRQTTPPSSPSNGPSQNAASPNPTNPGQAAQAQRMQPASPVPARSRWLGPIAGLAAGLGIAALLSHFGLGDAFASGLANLIVIALIAAAAIWLIRRFAGRRHDSTTRGYASDATGPYGSPPLNTNHGGYASGYPQEPSFRSTGPAASAPSAPASPYGAAAPTSAGFEHTPAARPALPSGFDADAFLRNAKVYFVRLQAAWDVGNLADIREFTTPEVFAEVKLDLDARGGKENQTDVVTLDAELLGVEDRGIEYFASVRFSGLIRETSGAAAEPFAEIWHLTKSTGTGEGWLLAGIQQLAAH